MPQLHWSYDAVVWVGQAGILCSNVFNHLSTEGKTESSGKLDYLWPGHIMESTGMYTMIEQKTGPDLG